MCQISSRSVYSVGFWRRKTSNFAIFGLRHSVVSPNGSSLRKLNTDAQLQTFPYPMVSKSFLYSNANMAKSGAQTDVQKRDEQTNRQTDRQNNSTFLAAPAAAEIRAAPNLAW